jgi:two-component system, NtrC family, nitrogen regulation sensor histidine kinase NtrY
VAFGAVTLLPLVPLTLVAREVIANRYRQELRRGLDEAVVETERAYDAVARDVERTAARMGRRDDPFARTLARMLVTREPGEVLPEEARGVLSDEAARELKARGLDVLVVVSGDGTILAAPGDPGREGTREPALLAHLRGVAGRAHVVEERPRFVRQGPGRLAVEAGREVSLDGTPQRTVWVVAGVWLDDALPDRSGQAVDRRVRPKGAPPAGARTRRVELDAGPDRPPVALELWASDRTLRGALTDLSYAAAALALGGAVLALLAGGMVARRLGGHLGALAVGADAIARGRRDLVLPVRGSDEIAGLNQRFNEMVGALADAEQSAVRAERVAAWREMAQHLAHELKNPLTPIQMSIETLQRTRARPERAADFDRLFEESARVILDEVTRLKHIVGEFSRFARLPAPQLGPVDVAEACQGAARLYEGATPIVRELPSDLPPVLADRDQLQQVLVNLLENAREAVAGSVEPRVVVRAQRVGDRVRIEVLDNGPGISAEVRDRLFQPYATGKPGGTGLGLALVQRIVVEHGGRVDTGAGLEGPNGPGAAFRVELPLAPSDGAQLKRPASP